MALLRHLLKYPLGNAGGQYLLRKQVKLCHWLMGIGSGTDVGESGEAALVRRWKRSNKRDLIVIDTGANQGQFLNLAVSGLGDKLCEIHSFEPAATTFATLQKNAPMRAGITLNNLALGTEAGSAELYYDKENSGLASLTKRDLGFRDISFDRRETIRLTTLDIYAAEKGIEHIDWLKIDVEGHELDVLKGANQLLSSRKIDLVSFEFGGGNIDTRTYFRDFFQLFQGLGLIVFRITPGGYFHPVTRYRETEEQFNTINYVACGEELGRALLK
jgi:FkbM family methyltransferase